MVAEGRDLGELGWEDSIKQDSQDFEPIPEGDYNCLLYTSFSNIVYCQSHGKANIMRALQYTIPE